MFACAENGDGHTYERKSSLLIVIHNLHIIFMSNSRKV